MICAFAAVGGLSFKIRFNGVHVLREFKKGPGQLIRLGLLLRRRIFHSAYIACIAGNAECMNQGTEGTSGPETPQPVPKQTPGCARSYYPVFCSHVIERASRKA